MQQDSEDEHKLAVMDTMLETLCREPLVFDEDEESDHLSPALSMQERRMDAEKLLTQREADRARETKIRSRTKSAKKRIRILHSARAHGFEEFFAEAPITPAEAALERSLYARKKTPAARMEMCVQRCVVAMTLVRRSAVADGPRFRAARKLDDPPWRERVFSAWLSLGGVSTGQKDYIGDSTGYDDPGMDMGIASPVINVVEEPDEDAVVDFTGLARVFFGSRCLAASGSLPKIVPQGPEVIINFLKYINKRDVLPEYREDINGAIEIAELAKFELTATKEFSLLSPGLLNVALSTLHGGYYQGLKAQSDWQETVVVEIEEVDDALKQAKELVAKSMPNLADLAQACRRVEVGMPVEVVNIDRLSEDMYMLQLKPWTIEGALEDDQYETDITSLQIYLEPHIAERVFVGLHFEADFYQLTERIWFFDTVTRVLPSFYVEFSSGDGDD